MRVAAVYDIHGNLPALEAVVEEIRRTQYDLANAAERIRTTKYPQAVDFAALSVLKPASEKQILEVFSRAELK